MPDGVGNYLEERPKEKYKMVNDDDDVEEKRESLAILASLGETKTYLGKEMTLGNIHKSSPKEVDRYYKRYQAKSSKQVSGTLIDGGIQLASRVVSCFVPIDDLEKLREDLKRDELVQRELSSLAGSVVLKGGRFVAFASALFQVASHVKFTEQVAVETSKRVPDEREQTVDPVVEGASTS